MDEIFINNYYKVLFSIYKNSIKIGNETYCPLNQEEIAKKLNISRANANVIFVKLQEKGYINKIARGKWDVTLKAKKIIKIMEKI